MSQSFCIIKPLFDNTNLICAEQIINEFKNFNIDNYPQKLNLTTKLPTDSSCLPCSRGCIYNWINYNQSPPVWQHCRCSIQKNIGFVPIKHN